MSFDIERLYTLLPAFYRIRDTEQGGPLKAFLSVIAEQIAILEEDIAQLNDDMFIETCSEWVVPYIGDLVGARSIFIFPDAPFNQRAFVANTLAYRRRKGTAAVLEQLARDVTNWDASVVEYFQVLATTQFLNHIRPDNISMADLRKSELLDYLKTPFDRIPRNADVRRIGSRSGKYNIPNVGLYLWRLGSYSMTHTPAFKLDEHRYLFDALGKDTSLQNRPVTEDEISHLAEPVNVPMPIKRRMLDRSLDAFYGEDKSILLMVNGQKILASEDSLPFASPPAKELSDIVCVCNLSDLKDGGGNVIGWSNMPLDKIALDPELGRIAFPKNESPPARVQVSYHYGFSADMGGGEYGRATTFSGGLQPVVRVPSDKTTIQEALDELGATGGIVEIEDNEYYIETPFIRVSAGKEIELRASDEHRPVIVLGEDLMVTGGMNSKVTLNGLLLSGGSLRVPLLETNEPSSPPIKNQLKALQLTHCTLLPGPSPTIKTVPGQPAMPRVFVESSDVTVAMDKCIVGGMRVTDQACTAINNSIVDASGTSEVAYAGLSGSDPGAALVMKNCTIIGKVHALMMKLVSNSIFHATLSEFDTWSAPVVAQRLQEGCVRFSYVPPGSKVPKRYRCQPKNENDTQQVQPVFTSLRYGDGAYCQLSPFCSAEIREGADDGSEMGVFHDLYLPQRVSNLRAQLDEYLRFGLEAGIFYET